MDIYIASIAVPINWFPGETIEQFEFKFPEKREPTHTDIAREVRALKKWRKYKVLCAVKK
jgi:hypothetical protein